MRPKSTCSVPGCEGLHKAYGWCTMHYQRWQRHGDPFATLYPTRVRGTPEERFWPKVNKSGPVPDYRPDLSPCWLWTEGKDGSGYGRFKINGHMVAAHRFAYELLVGSIPQGLELDHLCRVRHCVNTDHLEPVTNHVNVLRGFNNAAQNARKTHCPQGHPYDKENTSLHNGRRYCRTCHREWDARHLRHLQIPTQ